MDRQRIATGVEGLDRLLRGGLPAGSLVLLLGPPGSGKSTLARQFLYTAASRYDESIVLSTGDPQALIREAMYKFGWEQKYVERVKVIDCYSWKSGIKAAERSRESFKGKTTALDLRNLTEVSVAVTEFFERLKTEDSPCFVIDSFTDFLLNNDSDAAIRWLSQIKGRLQGRNVTALVLLEDGVHQNNVVSTVEYLADGTIRAKFDEGGRHIMVSRMVATPVQLGWSKFDIQKGIEVIVKDFFGTNETR